MKNQLKKATLLVGTMLAGCLAFGQAPVAGTIPPPNGKIANPAVPGAPGQMPPPPAGRPGHGPRGADRGPMAGLQTLTTISGKLSNYVANDRFVYNGFTLQENSQTVLVRFPEHIGSQLMAAAKKGESISVTGFSQTGPDGIAAFQLVTAKAGGTLVTDTPPLPVVQPVSPLQQNFAGTITDFRRNQNGMISGVVLSNKEVVPLPPPVIEQLQAYLKSGLAIQGTGFKDVLPVGAVAAPGMLVFIHPQTITLNGQTYLVR